MMMVKSLDFENLRIVKSYLDDIIERAEDKRSKLRKVITDEQFNFLRESEVFLRELCERFNIEGRSVYLGEQPRDYGRRLDIIESKLYQILWNINDKRRLISKNLTPNEIEKLTRLHETIKQIWKAYRELLNKELLEGETYGKS
jgi:hypothetical protein